MTGIYTIGKIGGRMNILVPMAGAGSRFAEKGYLLPKPLIDVAGKPMIQRALESLGIPGQYIFIIRQYKDRHLYTQLKETLHAITTDPIIVEVQELTDGAACTCLLAKQYINTEEPLLSINCDQIMSWDPAEFLKHVTSREMAGCVITYNSDSVKNSYIKLDENGYGQRLAEKEPISQLSLTGIHYWSKGQYFVQSAESMIEKNIRVNNEFYVAPTYNEMISIGQKITNFHIEEKNFHPVGTPHDLQKYLQRNHSEK